MFSSFYLGLFCELSMGDLTSFAKEENVCVCFLIENMDQKIFFPKECIITLFVWLLHPVKCIYVKIMGVLEGRGRLTAG